MLRPVISVSLDQHMVKSLRQYGFCAHVGLLGGFTEKIGELVNGEFQGKTYILRNIAQHPRRGERGTEQIVSIYVPSMPLG